MGKGLLLLIATPKGERPEGEDLPWERPTPAPRRLPPPPTPAPARPSLNATRQGYGAIPTRRAGLAAPTPIKPKPRTPDEVVLPKATIALEGDAGDLSDAQLAGMKALEAGIEGRSDPTLEAPAPKIGETADDYRARLAAWEDSRRGA